MNGKHTPADKEYHSHIESFNHNLKVLVTDIKARCPNDPMIYRAHVRTMTIINIDPLFVIDAVGPYLFQYHDQVYALEGSGSHAEDFFLTNNYDTELKASVNAEKADLVKYIIPKAKECIQKFEPDEKEQYKRIVIGMLDDYLEYKSLSAKRG